MSDIPYDKAFFDDQVADSLASAVIILPLLFQYYKPASVVDVGCGRGPWLKACLDAGVPHVLGIDGDYVDRAELLVHPAYFRAADLLQPLNLGRRFDLAISVEVAEHLPYQRSDSFVEDLTSLSDAVLFSAALPYQGGTHHVNEQWLEFWAILFRRHGFVAYDLFRQRTWANPRVAVPYSQNLMVFCKEELGRRFFPVSALAVDRPLSSPHPFLYLYNAERWHPLLPQVRDLEWHDYIHLVAAYVSGEISIPSMQVLEMVDSTGGALFPDSRTRTISPDELELSLAELRTLQAELSNSRAELKCAQRELSTSRDELNGARAELNAREVELSATQAKLTALTTELNNSQVDLNCLTDARQVALSGFHAARVELEEARAAMTTMRADLLRLQETANAAAEVIRGRSIELVDVKRRWSSRLSLIFFNSRLGLLTQSGRRRLAIRLIRNSGLFDSKYYLNQMPQLPPGIDIVEHYVETGVSAGYDPNPFFDTSYYLDVNSDVAQSGWNPLAHYIRFGAAEGRRPHPDFDTSYYAAQNPDAATLCLNPLAHYLSIGAAQGRPRNDSV